MNENNSMKAFKKKDRDFPGGTVVKNLPAQVLYDHLEGWDREGDARGRRYGDICICIADSLCYKAETNTPL